ncbi:MAG: class I SAM-dependent methyltransferase [Planctomycetota bacterium]
MVKRKMLVTALVRCSKCQLLHRVPTDDPSHNFSFYQEQYQSGMTTDLPDPSTLQALLDSKFRNTNKDISARIEVLKSLGVAPGTRVLDFGASWGYGTWQLGNAGFHVVGYEVSKPRARFGRENLSIRLEDDLGKLDGPFDLFFSSHVMEHVPSLSETIALVKRIVKPGGLFVAFTPNGSLERMRHDPGRYHRQWGDVHPNMLDELFYETSFPGRPKLFASDPYDHKAIKGWDRKKDLVLSLTGEELLCAIVM